MHEYQLLEIFGAGFFLALVFGYGAFKLGLSPIVGYLVAGFLVGPATPIFVADTDLAFQLSEAGVILLMFGVGLHFNTKDLLAVKGVALPGAIAQSCIATLLGTLVGTALGMSLMHGVILGMGLSVASTVVLLRVLTDNGVLNSVPGHVAVGWLVVEDLFTVLVLVLLPSLATLMAGGASGGAEAEALDFAKAMGLAFLRLALLWVLVMVVGGKVVPWVLTKVVRTRSEELFTLAVLVCAFATAVSAAIFFQASMALGAFLGGMVIGKTKVSHQAGADVLPLRDAFAVLFFISVGMLFRPAFILEQPLLILACLGIVLLAKPLTAALVVLILGYSTSTAVVAAVSLAQIGEFSFILAQAAISLDLIPVDVYNVLVICAIVSIALNPSVFRLVPKITAFLEHHPKLAHILNARAERRAAKIAAREARRNGEVKVAPADLSVIEEQAITAIVVGFGPVGRAVVKALMDKKILPVVIDMNADTVNQLNEERICPAIFGNSTKKDILAAAGIKQASYLIVTLPSVEQAVVTATVAKEMNPDIRTLVRARFLRDERLFEQIGVNGVSYEETAVADQLSALLQKDLDDCRLQDNYCKIDFDKLESADFNAAKDKGFDTLS